MSGEEDIFICMKESGEEDIFIKRHRMPKQEKVNLQHQENQYNIGPTKPK